MRVMLVAGMCSVGLFVSSAQAQSAGLPTYFVQAKQAAVAPGGQVHIDIFLKNGVDVGSYQLQLEAVDTSGKVASLNAMAVDQNNPTYLFKAKQIVEAKDMKGERLAVVAFHANTSPTTGAKPNYLATFTFDVPADASGSLTVNVVKTKETMLLASTSEELAYAIGVAVDIPIIPLAKTRTGKSGPRSR